MAKTKETKIERALILGFNLTIDNSITISCRTIKMIRFEPKLILISCYDKDGCQIAKFSTSNIAILDESFDAEKFKRTKQAILS